MADFKALRLEKDLTQSKKEKRQTTQMGDLPLLLFPIVIFTQISTCGLKSFVGKPFYPPGLYHLPDSNSSIKKSTCRSSSLCRCFSLCGIGELAGGSLQASDLRHDHFFIS